MSNELYIRDAETGLTVLVSLGENHTLVTEDFSHALIHDGKSYLGGFVNNNLGASASATLGVTVLHTVASLHAYFRTAVGGDTELWLYENATYSGGAGVTMFNRNRISTETLTCATVVSNPTITVAGAIIAHSIIPGGSKGNFSLGGSMSEQNGWTLKPSTQYIIKLTNLSSGSGEPVAMGLVILDEE
jgi:hypothetical protein